MAGFSAQEVPHLPIVSITGDGGFLFAMQELATAVQQQIGLITVVFNNNQFGNVQQMQKADYGGRVIASDLVNPDFVAMAQSFGATAERVDSPETLEAAIGRGRQSSGPVLIEVTVGDMPSADRFR